MTSRLINTSLDFYSHRIYDGCFVLQDPLHADVRLGWEPATVAEKAGPAVA